ncbi:hypothetical protein K488DRAFT_40354 [Vararia minispora EC-137]|uniref:Uncharacterized protein n=1 Tax=Vararia minispora EC-137 TaxID=1314806 RepID=A0ACB8QY33_9AGAM|nr:hypothetical protein K488DRAFT_40354 [Vararia minispora EC-137]
MLTRVVWSALSLVPSVCAGLVAEQQPFSNAPDIISTTASDVKVPVTLGVMSRCPDALLCEAVFDQVLKKVADKVDLRLTYIGKLNSSEPVFGVECLHGPQECAGNVQQLCVAKYRPMPLWWEYVMCQDYQSKEKVGLADIALKCARVVGIDWETSDVGRCAGLDGSGTGEEGIALLKESVQATKALNVEKSCTILINNEQICIHDETWKECENGHAPADFVRQIQAAYDKLNEGFSMI